MKVFFAVIGREQTFRVVNFGLRLANLAGKMLLSLYMARYFGLRDLGVFGLAFGCVMLAVAALGIRLDYIVQREISGYDSRSASLIFGDTTKFYIGNFAISGIVLCVLMALGVISISPSLAFVIFLLCIFESYANLLFNLTISIGSSTVASAFFFVRGGLWTIPVILATWINPDLRNAMCVLVFWLIGSAVSVVGSLAYLHTRGIKLNAIHATDVDWLRASLRSVFLVWVGSVANSFGGYVDRFVLAHYMSLEQVGVATFYLSFTGPVMSLIQSSTVAVSFPTLIKLYDDGDSRAYMSEFWRLARMALVLSTGLSFLVALFVPGFAWLSHRQALLASWPGLILLLLSMVVRTHAESAYFLLFIERKHTAIWLGNILFLLASSLLNILLVPICGIGGIGLAALISAALLLGWRSWFSRRPKSRIGDRLMA